jgi:hypothetical protein
VIVNVPIKPDEPEFSPEAIRALLALKLQASDQERLDLLTSKAQSGDLTPAERADLDQYLRLAERLAALQSKAQRWLDGAAEGTDPP